MKIRPISICLFSYRKRYYLTHPWVFVKDLWIGAKNMWHRARYGYAYIDAWNMNTSWCEIGANMLLHLAQYGNAYPGHGEFDTPEKWKAHLEDMAARLRKCADIDWNEENEYHEKYLKNPQDEEAREKWFTQMRMMAIRREQFIRETFEILGRNFDMYWD